MQFETKFNTELIPDLTIHDGDDLVDAALEKENGYRRNDGSWTYYGWYVTSST